MDFGSQLLTFGGVIHVLTSSDPVATATPLLGPLAPEREVHDLLTQYSCVFSANAEDYGNPKCSPLEFEVQSSRPIFRTPYRLSPAESKFTSKQISEWLSSGRISPSTSKWASPVMVVSKEGGLQSNQPVHRQERVPSPKCAIYTSDTGASEMSKIFVIRH